MAKPTTHYVCQDCGTSHSRWSGQCSGCGEWNRLVEEAIESRPKSIQVKKGKGIEIVSLEKEASDVPRLSSCISELDRVLGGGLVAGSAILIGGDPGIGKSTLLLQTVVAMAAKGSNCLYISGEESVHQISLRAHRLGLMKQMADEQENNEARPGGRASLEPRLNAKSGDFAGDNMKLSASASIKDIIATLDHPDTPEVVIIDSIQTMFLDSLDSAPGTVAQVRTCGYELVQLAKKRGFALFLVGHVTKDGQIAGPRVLEHMVDTVLYFEGERGNQFRILRSIKNRFGNTDEIGVFEMGENGLKEITNPSALFLSSRESPVSGSVVFAGMEGSRPLLVEIQALVAPSLMTNPRRAVVGWDANRLSMLLAVLDARCGISLAQHEVYLNVTGGFRISEVAADLAVAAAILSAYSDTPLPNGMVIFGEVGLSGEIRQVPHAERRLKEAEKLGFAEAIFPHRAKSGTTALPGKALKHVQELATYFMKNGDTKRRSSY